MRFRKTQMEILGFAIVVVVILLVTVFVVKFLLSDRPSGLRKEAIDTQLADATLDALLNTNVGSAPDCRNFKFKEVIIKCSEEGTPISCNGQSACNFAEEELKDKVFKGTLDAWGKRYQFLAKYGGQIKMEIKNYDCIGAKELDIKPKMRVLPASAPGENVEVYLYLCG